MIQIKNSVQIAEMKVAGRITGEALLVARENIREGISTYDLDKKIRHFIEKSGAVPSFLGYAGFPGSACISINDEVIHGIPSKSRILKEGDIVKVDVGARWHGYHGDSARTFPVGNVSEEAMTLIKATRQSFFEGIAAVKTGARLGDVGYAIESYVKQYGFSVVKKYVGHGVGHELHEDPNVPNFGTPGHGIRICKNMTLAIEPMINIGTGAVNESADGWTVTTADRKLSAHYENTILITDEGVQILTEVEKGF